MKRNRMMLLGLAGALCLALCGGRSGTSLFAGEAAPVAVEKAEPEDDEGAVADENLEQTAEEDQRTYEESLQIAEQMYEDALKFVRSQADVRVQVYEDQLTRHHKMLRQAVAQHKTLKKEIVEKVRELREKAKTDQESFPKGLDSPGFRVAYLKIVEKLGPQKRELDREISFREKRIAEIKEKLQKEGWKPGKPRGEGALPLVVDPKPAVVELMDLMPLPLPRIDGPGSTAPATIYWSQTVSEEE